MSNGSTFVGLHCWTNNVLQVDPSLTLDQRFHRQPPWNKRSIFLIILGFNDNKVVKKYLKILVRKSFQRFIVNDSPTVDAILCRILEFW